MSKRHRNFPGPDGAGPSNERDALEGAALSAPPLLDLK
jgi:hypothetical protein